MNNQFAFPVIKQVLPLGYYYYKFKQCRHNAKCLVFGFSLDCCTNIKSYWEILAMSSQFMSKYNNSIETMLCSWRFYETADSLLSGGHCPEQRTPFALAEEFLFQLLKDRGSVMFFSLWADLHLLHYEL